MAYETRSPEAAIVASAALPTPEQIAEQQEEQKLIRRMQMMMSMVMQVIAQDASLAMFPGKELAYELIWKPRFQRLMRERFRIM